MTAQDKPVQQDDAAKPKDSAEAVPPADQPKEHGGREGPDPTRYQDWERGGRCIDF